MKTEPIGGILIDILGIGLLYLTIVLMAGAVK
jgi:hypothetical protein